MNTTEIETILRDRCGDKFLGVFAIDQLPNEIPTRRPLMVVCNTDKASQPGQHWIAMYLDERGLGDYFDSFGRGPYGAFKLFLEKHCIHYWFNRHRLQSAVSRFCGHYTIWFLYYRNLKIDAAVLIRTLTEDTGLNDLIVHNFVCKNLKR